MILTELRTKLYLRQSELIGCKRRNRWVEEPQQWRNLRGNALVLLMADQVATIETPAGFVDIPVYGDSAIQFRGGTWKEWWEEDLRLLLAISKVYSELGLKGCHVLHEEQGDLTARYIDAVAEEASHKLVSQAVLYWKSYTRIAKNTPRAFITCTYCPVKERCDAADLETGATSDWRLP